MEKTNSYEIVLIFSEECDYDEAVNRITDVLQNYSNKKVKVDNSIGLKPMPYPIKGKEMGYYCLYKVQSDDFPVNEIERLFRINEDVIKFLIVKSENEHEVFEDYVADSAKSEQDKKQIVDVFNLIFGL